MRLSNIKYLDILLKLTDEEIEKIVFGGRGKIGKADIGIILGGTSMIPYRVDRAIELYKDGQIKKILISGGIGYFNFKRGITEAEIMKRYFLEHGVLEDDILIEDKSRNTYENFLYSYKLLRDKFNLENMTFILITSDFHMKRASGLFRHFFHKNSLYICPVSDRWTDKPSWKNSISSKRIIKQEALLLKYYIKHLKMEDITIE